MVLALGSLGMSSSTPKVKQPPGKTGVTLAWLALPGMVPRGASICAAKALYYAAPLQMVTCLF